MVRPGERTLAVGLEGALSQFERESHSLPGIQDASFRASLVEQFIESLRRVRYVKTIHRRNVSRRRSNPNDPLFDPVKAAILYQTRGMLDEAFWMVFYFVHFGRHKRGGWNYARAVYGRLGDPTLRWDWEATSADPSSFRKWLNDNQLAIKAYGSPSGFGNHRKYQSLDAYSGVGTGAAFESYVSWVEPSGNHAALFDAALADARGDPREAFRILYHSMACVASFGRTAIFDYLSMVSKLGLADIEPNGPYIQASTGPIDGARLLFGKHYSPKELDRLAQALGNHLGMDMQSLEDALCNWQKSPETFRPFRG